MFWYTLTSSECLSKFIHCYLIFIRGIASGVKHSGKLSIRYLKMIDRNFTPCSGVITACACYLHRFSQVTYCQAQNCDKRTCAIGDIYSSNGVPVICHTDLASFSSDIRKTAIISTFHLQVYSILRIDYRKCSFSYYLNLSL